jgi:ribosome-binding protein aMBF1 (putative translation factor)
MLIKINGKKLKKQRGGRSLSEISELADRAFSDVALLKWEGGKMQPKEDNIKALLKVFGCRLEDIADPLQLN